MKTEKQKEKEKELDFMYDVSSLVKQYNFTLEHALSLFKAKPKTNEDLLLTKAIELYPKGTKFIPVGKNKTREVVGVPELLCGRILVFDNNNKLHLVFSDGIWAEIVK